MLPCHFRLLVLGCCDYGLGDLARHWPRGGRGHGLSVEGVLFRDTALSEVGFRGQGGGWLVEMVQRRVVGDVVRVEVVVIIVVLWVWQPVLLLQGLWLWSSGGGRTLGLGLATPMGRGDAARGGLAAAGRGLRSVQDFGLRDAVPDGLVRRVQVFLVGGPGLAAGDGLQGVCAAGGGVGGGGWATKVALTKGGDSRAGAA